MPFLIVRNDITKMHVDAIVNAANRSLLGGGGVDGSIHRAAGPKLLDACRALGGCETGQAKITKGYRLPCKYVIHTVGPIYRGGRRGERELLLSCYQKSLALAKAHRCETVAFPLISSGAIGCPKAEALQIATNAITAFLLENDMTVYLVIYDRASYQIGPAYIDENYIELHPIERSMCLGEYDASYAPQGKAMHAPLASASTAARRRTLNDALSQIDESFSEMLLRRIDEKGLTDAQ